MVKSLRLILKMEFSEVQITKEAKRLHEKLQFVGFNKGYCEVIAPLTLEINRIKREKNAVILAHSYQTPDIIYGVADYTGDSYGLSKKAAESGAEAIIFCGVKFMAETAAILSPGKKVYLPAPEAGCSLADSISASDVRDLKKQHPGVKVVVYVNTTAEVKAEADYCCTSSNALKIIESIPGEKVIFLPDTLMAENLRARTSKELISWPGKCIVHEEFGVDTVNRLKKTYKGLKVLSHLECSPSVVNASDMAGGTGDMIKYAKQVDAPAYFLVTECGLSDRMRVELPEKNFVGMCGLCPYMKMITLPLILQVLQSPRKEQRVHVNGTVATKALKSLEKMFELTEK